MKILSKDFFQRDTVQVARDLIGKKLIRKINNQIITCIITETEAYTHDDPASHCYIGKTQRNIAMFGPVGHAYIYISYGIHFCFNIVSRDLQSPAGGVLIRAGIVDNQIITGPGNLTKALSINKSHYGLNLIDESSEIYILDGLQVENSQVQITPRIGISKAKDKPWRFLLKK